MIRKLFAVTTCCLTMLCFSHALQATEEGIAVRHKAEGVECASCHGDDNEAIVVNATCLECHNSYEELAGRTEDMHLNPHKNPHFLDLDCTSCHIGHRANQNFCQDCHGPIKRGEPNENNTTK